MTAREIIRYHGETKHHFHRFARSAGYMDWENQPDPFRYYEGTTAFPLPMRKEDPASKLKDLYLRETTSPQPFMPETIGGFLELSLGLSAWKGVGDTRWALRMNPSSGNLHPTEAHLILPSMGSLEAGVYHYDAYRHALEARAALSKDLQRILREHFGTTGFLIGLTSIFWRESWKYGERALRYCELDLGHALACVSLSANLQGWKTVYLNAVSDEEIEVLLGLDKVAWQEEERESAGPLCFVCPNGAGDVPRHLTGEVLSGFRTLLFGGTPNVLSKGHVEWKIIQRTASLYRKPRTEEKRYDFGSRPFPGSDSGLSAAAVIRKRRSAVAFDPEGRLARRQFLSILDRTLPRNATAPFDVELMEPSVHLLIFVHRVGDLTPGMYLFPRNPDHAGELKRLAGKECRWEEVDSNPCLYLLLEGDFRQHAILLSCEQDIAGSGAFSLGMIARFRPLIEEDPFRYRHLLWEAGMVGQVLYLEAEAVDRRGTGMGCYFDDPVHDTLGLQDDTYQSLYHFAVGNPIPDRRLTTYPPYDHLKS